MKNQAVHTANIKALTAIPVNREVGSYRILVVVGFGGNTNNTLEYALKLAKASHGTIDLYHLSDINDIPNTDNPQKFTRIYDALLTRASERLNAFSELITEYGITVNSSQSTIGIVADKIWPLLEQIKPDLIILGNDRKTKGIVSSLQLYNRYPWLTVPEAADPKMPSKIVLISDGKPISAMKLQALFTMVRKMDSPLFILNINKEKGILMKYSVPIKTTDFKNSQTPYEVIRKECTAENFIQEYGLDLICVVQQPGDFLEKLGRHESVRATLEKEFIPLLVLPN